MKAYDAYVTYKAIMLHFKSNSYDYFKYNGKTKVSKETFLYKEKGKYFYKKLADKYGYSKQDLIKFLIFVFSRYDVKWIGDIFNDDIDKAFQKYSGFMDSLSYTIPKELHNVLCDNNLKPLFVKNKDINLPNIIYLYLQNKISIETIIILDIASKNRMIEYWNKNYGNDLIIFNKFYKLQSKLRKFYFISYERSQEILKDFLTT